MKIEVQIDLQTASSEDNPNSSTGPGTHNTVHPCCTFDHSRRGAELRGVEGGETDQDLLDERRIIKTSFYI